MKSLLFLISLLCLNSLSLYSQCTGDCENGYGKLQKGDMLYQGFFAKQKFEGQIIDTKKKLWYFGSADLPEMNNISKDLFWSAGFRFFYNEMNDIPRNSQECFSREFGCLYDDFLLSTGGRKYHKGIGYYFFKKFKYQFCEGSGPVTSDGDLPFDSYYNSYYGPLNEDGFPNGYGLVYCGPGSYKEETKGGELQRWMKFIKFDSIYFENGKAIKAKLLNLYADKGARKIPIYNIEFIDSKPISTFDDLDNFTYTTTPTSKDRKNSKDILRLQELANIKKTYFDPILKEDVHIGISKHIDSVYFDYISEHRQKLIYKEIYNKTDTIFYHVFGKRYYPYEDEHLFDAYMIFKKENNVYSTTPIYKVIPQFNIPIRERGNTTNQFKLANYNPFLDKTIIKNDDFYKKINRILNNASRSNKYKNTYDIIKLVDSKFSWVYQNKYENIVSSKALPFRYVVAETKPALNCKSELKYSGRAGGEDPTIKTTTTKGEYLGNDSNGKGVYTEDKTETNFSLGSLGNETFKFLCNCNSEPPSKSIATVWKGYNYHVMGVEGIEWESYDKIVYGLEEIYKERKWNFITKKELELKSIEAEKNYTQALASFKKSDYEDALNYLNEAAKLIPYGKYYSGLNDLLSELKKYEISKIVAFTE